MVLRFSNQIEHQEKLTSSGWFGLSVFSVLCSPLVSIFSLNSYCNYQVGNGGVGFIWSVSEGEHEEEWRHSVAPIPTDKLLEITQAAHDDLELTQDGNVIPNSGELGPEGVLNNSDDDDTEDIRDDSVYFEKEVYVQGIVMIIAYYLNLALLPHFYFQVEATFLRAVDENVKEDHIVLEVNSLRYDLFIYFLCFLLPSWRNLFYILYEEPIYEVL